MDTQGALNVAGGHLKGLSGHIFDLLTVTKPVSQDAAINLSKVISKLSPLLGNLIEFNSVEFLNTKNEFTSFGKWMRQDPGFPDVIFDGSIKPTPGFEIKAWFPLATEITGRFKDSQNHFTNNNTDVCLLAWLPEHILYGKPYILDVFITSGASIAKARDDHYHNPPDYLVMEPQDTSSRTSNLQQTNTNGLKFQGTPAEFTAAQRIVASWGPEGRHYKPTPEYQARLRELTSRFEYRLDTNFAKMDRVAHSGLEQFKTKVMGTQVNGMTVKKWERLFRSTDENAVRQILLKNLGIKEVAVENLVV
jgi:hypothetical protein